MGNKKNTRSVRKLPMDQAAAAVYDMGLTSYYQYLKICSSGERPAYLPSNLSTYYDEYPGWDAFLALGKKVSNAQNIFTGISYAELKYIVHRKNLSSKGAYLKAFRNGELPPGTPSDPENYYPEFEGWNTFLPPKRSLIPYEEAKKIVHAYNLKSSYQWRNFCRDGNKPDGIPVLPDRDYPEFISWEDFLGYSKQ